MSRRFALEIKLEKDNQQQSNSKAILENTTVFPTTKPALFKTRYHLATSILLSFTQLLASSLNGSNFSQRSTRIHLPQFAGSQHTQRSTDVALSHYCHGNPNMHIPPCHYVPSTWVLNFPSSTNFNLTEFPSSYLQACCDPIQALP